MFFIRSSYINKYSLNFNGVDEYLNFGDILNFERIDTFTICMLFKTSANTGTIISRLGGSPTYRGWILEVSNGRIELNLSNDISMPNIITVRTVKDTFNDNIWHRGFITYDGSSLANGVNIYVDNIDEPLSIVYDTLTADIANNTNMNIGAINDGVGNLWSGNLDQIAIYLGVLPIEDIQRIDNTNGRPLNLNRLYLSTNLFSWWTFTEDDITNLPTIKDRSLNSYDGTAINMNNTNFDQDTI